MDAYLPWANAGMMASNACLMPVHSQSADAGAEEGPAWSAWRAWGKLPVDCCAFPRYDTLKRDSQGASITGLLNFTSDLDATQRPASQAASGNCVLLTGKQVQAVTPDA
jgi:hypothetical protein